MSGGHYIINYSRLFCCWPSSQFWGPLEVSHADFGTFSRIREGWVWKNWKVPVCGLEVMSRSVCIDGSVAIPGNGLPGIASILWDSEEVLGPYFIFNNTWPALTSYLVFQLSSRTWWSEVWLALVFRTGKTLTLSSWGTSRTSRCLYSMVRWGTMCSE